MTTLVALGRLLRPVEITGQSHLPVLSIYREHGIVPKASRQDNYNKTPDDLSRYLKVSPGDLVVNKMKAWSGSVAVSAHEGIVSGDYLVCRVTGPLLPPYLHYVVRSSPFVGEMRARSTGIRPNQERLYWDDLSSIAIEVPSIVEQRRIADFLDDQTTRIDNIIALRQRQMQLMVEKRLAFDDWVVLSCRDEAQPCRLKWLLTEVDQRTRGTADDSHLLSVSIHRGVTLRSEVTDDPHRADSLESYKVVRTGDLVLNRMRAFQGAVGVSATCGIVSPDYAVLRCQPGLIPQFAHFLFRSRWFVGEMIVRLRGLGSVELGAARTPRINVADLMDISVPAPTVARQQEHLEELREHSDSFEQTRGLLDRHLRLLQEFKRSLISAAVSGEFDVSTASGRGVPA